MEEVGKPAKWPEGQGRRLPAERGLRHPWERGIGGASWQLPLGMQRQVTQMLNCAPWIQQGGHGGLCKGSAEKAGSVSKTCHPVPGTRELVQGRSMCRHLLGQA